MIGGQVVSRIINDWGLSEHITVGVEPDDSPAPDRRTITFTGNPIRWFLQVIGSPMTGRLL